MPNPKHSILGSGFAFHIFMLGSLVYLSAGPVEELGAWLKVDRLSRPTLQSQAFANAPLSALESEQAKTLIWTERTAYLKTLWTTPWNAKRLVNKDNLAMPFDYRIYGSKPAAGYDLYTVSQEVKNFL
jgi:hypothetical protein